MYKCHPPRRKSQIILLKNGENKGVSYSRNRALDIASGEYIGWVDADDWVENDMFENLMRASLDTNSDISYCHYVIDGVNGPETQDVADLTSPDKERAICNYLMRGSNYLWNKLVKRRLFTDNEIRFANGHDFCEDFNVSTKVLYYARSVTCVNKAYYHYRVNAASICHSQSKKKHVDGLYNVISIYDFITDRITNDTIRKCICHNVLNAKFNLWYYDKDISSLQIRPETNRYIVSNPFLGIKAKIVVMVICAIYAMILWTVNHVKI